MSNVLGCSKFSQLCFYQCQILFELVYSWENYHNNKKDEVFYLRYGVYNLTAVPSRLNRLLSVDRRMSISLQTV